MTSLPDTTAGRVVMGVPAKMSERAEVRRRRTVMQVTWSLVAGGAETYALTVASGLDASKYRSVMCGIDQGGALEPEVRRRGVPYHIMNRRPGVDWRLMGRMFQLLRREKVDVIHTHHLNQLLYSVVAARLLGIRIVHTEHSVEMYKSRKLRWMLRLLSIFCHRVTAIGADGERVLREKVGIPAGKLEIVRAAVDLGRFNVPRAAAREALGLKPADRAAVIVARLFPEKNHRLLLAAFAEAAARVPDAKLLIVGDGVEQAAIEEVIAKLNLGGRVAMLGVRRDIPQILAGADVFVLSSDREGLPIAVLEAMAAGLPVIATSVGDLPLVVKDGQTGLLVPRRDVGELAKALVRLLGDAEPCERMGRGGRELVSEAYSLDQLVKRHSELYGVAE